MAKEKGSGLQGQIVDFFERNPSEFLLVEDISLKWTANRRQVNAALSHLRKAGAIQSRDGLVMRGVANG